jgi:DNA polymerase-3 subunit gamma/tau
MAYEVIARKWRPQIFSEVVGQDHVVKTLCNAIEQNRIAQAYLLAGPRGTGKTTVARIFAKALNCKNGPTATPCCKCDSCRDIANGTSLDVTEIDGASNNGVADVHSKIIDNISFAPVGGKFHIYYIDEVHMLSGSAFNALLKTLEEPPPYVKFIFATTEPDRIIGTILSRCQRFDLRRISLPALVGQLKKIAVAEKIEIDDDALLAIARGADGGMRDAESAFDQMIAFTGSKIHESDVLSVFGLAARSTIESLASAVLSGDVRQVLTLLNDLDNSGKDLRRLTAEIINHFRNLLVCIQLDGNTSGLDLTDSQCATLLAQSKAGSTTAVLTIVENLIDLENKMRLALSQRTMIETTLIRCARATHLVDLETILKKLTKLGEGAEPEPARTPPAAVAQPPAAKPAKAPATAAEPPPAPKPAPTAYAAAPHPVGDAEKNERLIEHPIVKEALKIFDGTISDIKHKH